MQLCSNNTCDTKILPSGLKRKRNYLLKRANAPCLVPRHPSWILITAPQQFYELQIFAKFETTVSPHSDIQQNL